MSLVKEEKEFCEKLDFKLWQKLFAFTKPYKKEVIILILSMIMVAGVDALYPVLTMYAIDNFIVPGKLEGLEIYGLAFLGLVLLSVFNVWLFIAVAGKIEMFLQYDIRKKGFKHLQDLAFSYYDKTPVGWIMARMTSDVQKLGEIISWGIVDMIWGLTMMTFISGIMIYLNWKLALITLSVIPLLALVSYYFQQKILRAYRDVRKLNSKITGSFAEGINGAKTTKTLVREKENLKEFKIDTKSMYGASVKSAVLSSLYLPIVLVLSSVGTAMALWFGGENVLANTLTYGTLVAFISYSVQFFEPVQNLARIFAEFQSAQASGERIISLLDTKSDIVDSPEVIEKFGDYLNPKKENWPAIKGNISFKNVDFKYKGGEQVLSDFNIDIKAGDTVALVGETGSGKSTIINLICRFIEPVSGDIEIDGVDYRQRSLHWLHSHLGYVLQSPHLFSGTIKENIRYGRMNATDDEVEKAAMLVNAHEFITSMEKGYDSEVGEGGNLLSTGQKQLVSFARAVLADPALLVLDEATSSVDTETEQKIQRAIDVLLEGRTSFIVAHRLSTIKTADRILVISKGRIIEDGSHHDLILKKGYYYKLYTNQFQAEREEELYHESA